MHKHVYAAAALVLAMACPAFAQGAAQKPMPPKPMPPKSVVSDKLMANETKLLEAVKAKDVKTFSSLVQAGSWSIDEGGLMGVDDFIKMLGDPKTDMKIEMLKATDMHVVDLDANTAVVTYKAETKGSMMGQPFPPVVWTSTTWMNKGGTWKAVFHQESTAAPVKK